tara:strand:+ start:152 stop:628 length:477 start_codon:yes stop_codon:yes gene_type:complete
MHHSQIDATILFLEVTDKVNLVKFSAFRDLFEASIRLQIGAFNHSNEDPVFGDLLKIEYAATHNAIVAAQRLLVSPPSTPTEGAFLETASEALLLLQKGAPDHSTMTDAFCAAMRACASTPPNSDAHSAMLRALQILDKLIELQVAQLELNINAEIIG